MASLHDYVGQYLFFEADALMSLAHNFNSQNVFTIATSSENKHPRKRRCNMWEYNIKMDIRQIGCVNCVTVAQEKDNKVLDSKGMSSLLIRVSRAMKLQQEPEYKERLSFKCRFLEKRSHLVFEPLKINVEKTVNISCC